MADRVRLHQASQTRDAPSDRAVHVVPVARELLEAQVGAACDAVDQLDNGARLPPLIRSLARAGRAG
jgi:hypothetical protein